MLPRSFALLACIAVLLPVAPSVASVEDGILPPDPRDYRDHNFDYFVTGNPSAPRAAHTQFALALMGGGGRVDAAYRTIASHAGGGHILILRSVSDDSYDPTDGNYGNLFASRWGPVVSAETVVFHNRQASFDPRVIAMLERADGIFLAGGDQANYIRYWKGTPVQRALNAHVRANRPIGGSSAGLAILGHFSYTSLDGQSLESKTALSDPFSPSVTLESDFLHYRWLEHVITDTHFSARCRLGRLIVFVARLGAQHPGEGIYGIGVDENTALLVDAAGIGRVAPGSAGSAWLVMLDRGPGHLQPKQPVSLDGIHIVRADESATVNLRNRQVEQPAEQMTGSLIAGAPRDLSSAALILSRDRVPPDED